MEPPQAAAEVSGLLHSILQGKLIHRDILTPAAMARTLLLQIDAGEEDAAVLERLLVQLFPAYHLAETRGWPALGDPRGDLGSYSATAQLAMYRALLICCENPALLNPIAEFQDEVASEGALGVFGGP